LCWKKIVKNIYVKQMINVVWPFYFDISLSCPLSREGSGLFHWGFLVSGSCWRPKSHLWPYFLSKTSDASQKHFNFE
jgi:hypothetical protein